MKSITSKIKQLFDKPSIEELAAYQHKIPSTVAVRTTKDPSSGALVASVVKIDNKKVKGAILTEADDYEELIEMVNDAVLTYLDIPERIAVYMPKLLPTDINYENKTNLVFAK